MTKQSILGGGGYLEEIDLAKGFAILLAVIGHSFPDAEIGWIIAGEPSFASFSMHWIYSFHMAVFFMFAGFLFIPRINKSDVKASVEKRCKRLLVPYLFYSLIYVVLKTVGSTVANHPLTDNVFLQISTGVSPAGGCWFLWVLFMISMVCLLLRKLGAWGIFAVSVVMFFLYQYDHSWMIGKIYEIFVRMIWFALGGIIALYFDEGKKITHNPFVGLIAFCVLTGLQCMPATWYVNIIKTVSGIIMTCSLAYGIIKYANGSWLHKGMKLMGDYCMDIYLLSMLVVIPMRILYINFGLSNYIPYYPWVAIVSVMGVLVPVLASKYAVRKYKWSKLLMIGGRTHYSLSKR